MDREQLTQDVSELARTVVSDPRWRAQNDDFGVSVLGMILYGYALAKGRTVMMLDIEDIDAATFTCVKQCAGSADSWTLGLIAEASRSAFDPAHHAANHQLVGVGHSYYGVDDRPSVVDNVFANLEAFRAHA